MTDTVLTLLGVLVGGPLGLVIGWKLYDVIHREDR